jgi:hypothetical protein
MLEAALFPKRLSSHLDFLAFVFNVMWDPDPNPDPEPEPECITIPVTIRQKRFGSFGSVPQLIKFSICAKNFSIS